MIVIVKLRCCPTVGTRAGPGLGMIDTRDPGARHRQLRAAGRGRVGRDWTPKLSESGETYDRRAD